MSKRILYNIFIPFKYCLKLLKMISSFIDKILLRFMICYPFLKSKYFGYLNINYDRKLYKINCGIGSTFMDSDWDLTLDDKSNEN